MERRRSASAASSMSAFGELGPPPSLGSAQNGKFTNFTDFVEMAFDAMNRNLEAPPANVTWHDGHLSRAARKSAIGYGGATIWLTGLPASGKSTIAIALERDLVLAGRPAYVLDGDNLRHGLSRDLGFGPGARAEHVRRVAHVGRVMADAGVVALVSLVSPYAADRLHAREVHERDGLPFLEVFVDTPLAECERRDPKGLYAKARAGEIPDFTGVSMPYEQPADAELTITPDEPLEHSVWRLLEALHRATS